MPEPLTDVTDLLCMAVYGKVDPSKWLGGSNAKMLHDAKDTIQSLRGLCDDHVEEIYRLRDRCWKLEGTVLRTLGGCDGCDLGLRRHLRYVGDKWLCIDCAAKLVPETEPCPPSTN